MARPTLEAVPFSDIQGQRIDDVTTMPTAFTAGEPTVNFNQRSPIPLALVIELTYQLSSGVGGGSFPRQTSFLRACLHGLIQLQSRFTLPSSDGKLLRATETNRGALARMLMKMLCLRFSIPKGKRE